MALEWVPRVTIQDKTRIELQSQKDLGDEFFFKELNSKGNYQTITWREIYYPVLYVEPFEINKSVIGFDLGSDPERLKAIERTLHEKVATATAPITLLQSNRQGFLYFYPIFSHSQEPIGLALAVFENQRLFMPYFPRQTVSILIFVYPISP